MGRIAGKVFAFAGRLGYSLHMRNQVEKYVEQFIREQDMIVKGDVVIAGVSGGADSVCLLFVLCALREKIGFEVKVCHVNHGLRGADADADEEYVKRLCRELGVSCRFFHENVELIARKRKQSPEEAGRMVRRGAFETMCREDGGTKIATAHHRDDNAETVIWNLARGTGLRGLGGIRPVQGRWIRPLLVLSRKQAEEYLRSEGVSWCEDATNREDDYTRNRIRHHILPALEEQVNSRAVCHLNELARQARDVWDYLERGVDSAWDRCVVKEDKEDKGGIVLRIDEASFREEMPAVRAQLLRRCIALARGGEQDIAAAHVNAAAGLFDRQTGRAVHLPGEIRAERTYTGITIRREKDGKIPDEQEAVLPEIRLRIPGEAAVPSQGLRITCRFVEDGDLARAKEMPQKSYTKWFDYDIIKHGLSARNRRSGDYFTTDDRGSRQKLKSYLINEKIPQEERKKLLLIADGDHIVWIPGRRMSRAYQVSSETKNILEIKITEEM